MDLSEIIAITGKPGLYKVLGQTKSGVIVESLTDKKRFPVFSAYQVSALDEISIYTEEEDMPLADVMQKIYDAKKGKEAISHNAKPQELSNFFNEVLPEYDKDRVYASDIKKVVRWYNILLSEGLLKEEKEKKEESSEKKESKSKENKTEKKEAKPKKGKTESKAKKQPTTKKKPATKKKAEEYQL